MHLFSELVSVATIEHVPFLDRLLSPRIMFLRVIYAEVCISSSFLCMAEYYSIIWLYYASFIELMDVWVVSSFWLF